MTLIGFSVFIIALNTYPYAKNGFLLFLGSTYFFYTILNFLHLVSYKGINIIVDSTNVPTQLWISERYLLALAFFAAPFFLGKKFSLGKQIISTLWLTVISVSIILSIFIFSNFPTAHINGSGLTPFKIYSEYIISSIFFLDLIIFYLKRKQLGKDTYTLVSASLILSILAELAFTKYVSVYGNFNMVGHVLVFASILFIYAVFIRKTLNDPYSILFRELSEANAKLSHQAVTDHLTGLYNRRATMEKVNEQFNKARRFRENFSIIMIDLDNFKTTNDTHGHSAGDKVLVEFANILKRSLRDVDIVGRHGGDEFIVCPIRASVAEAEKIVEKIKKTVNKIIIESEKNESIRIKFSAGIYNCIPRDKKLKADHIIHMADAKLLEAKKEARAVLSTLPDNA